jgi:hypothetical protein
MIGNLMSLNRNYQIRILMKHSKLNKGKGDLSKEIIDIQDKPDVSVWSRKSYASSNRCPQIIMTA